MTKVNGTDSASAAYTVKSGDTFSEIAQEVNKTIKELTVLNPQIKDINKLYPGQVIKTASNIYTVKAGDTLSEIAAKFSVSVKDIQAANKKTVSNPDLIKPGMNLVIPAKKPAQVTVPAAPKPAPVKPVPVITVPTPPAKPAPAQPTPPAQTQPDAPRLTLGVNERFRNDLLFAEKRTGVSAASLAAVINAEAAKKAGVWDVNSFNSGSNAAGLTQFLRGTWITMATTKGTYLNEVATQKGLVSSDAKPKVLNETALLNPRYDSLLSIVSAAEYDKQTLALADKLGLVPKNLPSDQMAQYMYYAHHEGPGGVLTQLADSKTASEDTAKQILTIRLGGADKAAAAAKESGSYKKAYQAFAERKAQILFPLQIGQTPESKKIIESYVKKYGSYEAGYRAWLTDYTAKMVRPSDFLISAPVTPTPPAPDTVPPIPAKGIADTSKMTEAQKYTFYEQYFTQAGKKLDTGANEINVLGLRVPTSLYAGNKNGLFDDRIVVMYKDEKGNPKVVEFEATTDPNAFNMKGGAQALDGFYKYSYYNENGQVDAKFNTRDQAAIKPRDAVSVRDINADGTLSKTVSSSKIVYFHEAYSNSSTGSGGCQTLRKEDFQNLWNKMLNDPDKTFNYLLKTVQ